MGVLGSVGQIYMFILLALLFAGAGLSVWAIINNFASKGQAKQNNQISTLGNQKQKTTINNIKILGGFKMANNGWFKLAIFSFVGILISIAVLGFTSANGMNSMNMQNGMSGMNMGAAPMSNMNMQSGMNGMNMGATPMNSMNMQGGMMPTNMQSGMQMGNTPMNNMNTGMPNDYMMMQQQLQQMQMQLRMMQQQQQQMNNNNMQQNNSSNMNGNSGGMSMM